MIATENDYGCLLTLEGLDLEPQVSSQVLYV